MKRPRPNPITDRNQTKEVWFISATQRLTGETSPRNEEAVVFRDLLENADEVRAAMRYDGLSSRLNAAEDAATVQWMTYVVQIRTDMYHRMVSQATGKEHMTFAHAGWPQRMVPHFAVGSWGSTVRYETVISGNELYAMTMTITPPDGVKVTVESGGRTVMDNTGTTRFTDRNVGMSNAENESLVLSYPAISREDPRNPSPGYEPSEVTFTEIVIRVDLFDGSDIKRRFESGEQFSAIIGHEPVQTVIEPESDPLIPPYPFAGQGSAVSILFN